MDYPTLEQVEAADHYQLAKWYRFLPSPDFNQEAIMDRIIARFTELGGMTPTISKSIGWER